MKITKTAVVSVVGRPNVGKSTLTNKLVGQKVAIVSSKPQTTRTRITGLLNKNGTQYVFLDTPGLHKPRTQLGDYMCKVVTDTVSEVDAAMLVVEPIANIGPAEESLIAQIKAPHMPAVLVINKIDTVKKEELLNVIATYAAAHEFEAVVPISARTGEGLDDLLGELSKYAIEGPQLFPEDMVSDQPERVRAAEIIRADGHGIPELLDAILALMPLDTYAEKPVLYMAKSECDRDLALPILDEYKKIIEKYDERGEACTGYLERYAFYDKADCYRLHTPGRECGFHFFPQYG